jgi:glycerol-3-phosphate acyltransferase PlsY
MRDMAFLICVIGSYLIGSVSFAVLASRIFRLPDPRTYGSGNPGAANVLRSGKVPAALFTLFGDAAKGVAAVLLARLLGPSIGVGSITVALCALAVVLGHLYPVFFGFKGGKGVATAFGALLALNPWAALVAIAVFLLAVALFRYVSLGSILAAVAAAVVDPLVFGWSAESAAVLAIAVLVIWRHRANIQRLQRGTESRLSLRRRDAPRPG